MRSHYKVSNKGVKVFILECSPWSSTVCVHLRVQEGGRPPEGMGSSQVGTSSSLKPMQRPGKPPGSSKFQAQLAQVAGLWQSCRSLGKSALSRGLARKGRQSKLTVYGKKPLAG